VRERAPAYALQARERLPGAEAAFGAWDRERRAAGILIAGGVAFRFFLWLVPLGLALAALVSFWGEYDSEGLEDAANEFGIGVTAMETAEDALETSDGNRIALLLVAVGLTAWFSLGAVRALLIAFALAWNLERPRLRKPLRAVGIFNGLYLLSALGPLALAWLREQVGLGGLVGLLLTFALGLALALLVMWLLPRRAERWQELLPGAALVAVGFQLLHAAVVFYFAPKLERSSELYGSLGVAAAILLWLYFSARLLTAGAFLNAALWERRLARSAAAQASSE
jgi:uncharacterized BrkB/YihY/UPF0761 family membrane protein